jgi:hypothetical protein
MSSGMVEEEVPKTHFSNKSWCKYYVHVYVNGKMIPVVTIPGMELAGEQRRMMERVNSSSIYCKNFVNITLHHQHNNKKIKKNIRKK